MITISTARLIFPGMPGDPSASEGAKPTAVRALNIELASDNAVEAASKASMSIPEALGYGKSVDLMVERSAPEKPEPSKVELREYWGSSQNIAADQPKITTSSKHTDEDIDDSVPDRSFAFWPSTNPKSFEESTDLAGVYTLKSNFCANTSVTLTKDQNFLEPLNITTSATQADLSRPITVRWKPVAGAVGYILTAFGGNEKYSITWTSSAKPELARRVIYRPVTQESLENYIKEGVIIPAYVVSNTIPAGVFKGSNSVMLRATAVGRDIVQTNDDITTWILVRSTSSVPLYSKLAEASK